jgi:hypothetical protein
VELILRLQFISVFRKIFKQGHTELQLKHLFMKIDANSNGGVDWDEFSTYIMLEHQSTAMAREADAVPQWNESVTNHRTSHASLTGTSDIQHPDCA